jgi:hypothetical protein
MAKPKPEIPPVQMPLRVDPALKLRLEAWAVLEEKSLNQVCAELLDHGLKVRGQ